MARTKKEHVVTMDDKQAADLQIKEMQKQIDSKKSVLFFVCHTKSL